MSDNTRWIVGTGIVLLIAIIASVYTGVSHLTGLQSEMERRLSEKITGTEERLAQRIERVDNRLADDLSKVQAQLGEQIGNVATDLRTVEDETAPLADLADRLVETIESSEKRLSQDLQGTEKRLTARIDKIDDRLLKVEGESASLSAIVKSSWVSGEASWPLSRYEEVSGYIAGGPDTPPDPEIMEAMKKAGINVQWIGKPMNYRFANEPLLNAYRHTVQKHPDVAEELVQAYAELVREQLGLRTGDSATEPPADAE